MKFDSVIIGGGLSGLLCGIRLAKAGQRCAIISSGQSALHFSSGSFDLLGTLPDGTAVENPLAAVTELAAQEPSHPYARMGADNFGRLAAEAAALLAEAGLPVSGDASRNHLRLSPAGEFKRTWLTIDGYLRAESDGTLPWRRVALFDMEGFLDFYGQFVGDALREAGVTVERHVVRMAALERLRTNPSEMRSANVARLFDRDDNLDELIRCLAAQAGDCDAVLLPAVPGIDRSDALRRIGEGVGRPVAMVATMPPSVPGVRMQLALRRSFERLGGTYLLGDTAVRCDVKEGAVTAVYTVNHGDIPFLAENYVLATGSFFSRGLTAERDAVREPLFGADVEFAGTRSEWYDRDLFAPQPFERFGVATDDRFRALRGGEAVTNLYVAGAGLAGFDALTEGCGAGVSALTALYAAERILSGR